MRITSITNLVAANPVLAKELRLRMRGWRSPAIISAYIGVIGLIAFGYFQLRLRGIYMNGFFDPFTGLQIYTILAVFQLGLIGFVTPALTAGSISGERERQTLDLLLCTKLSAFAIVSGKLLSSLSYILLLILASMPVFSFVFFFGGVALSDLLALFLYYAITALTFGSIGIFCSTLIKKTQLATVLSYIIIFLLTIGTLFIAVYLTSITPSAGSGQMPAMPKILYLNPLAGLASILSSQSIPYISFYGPTAMQNIWKYHVLFNLGLIIFFIGLSVYFIRPVRQLPAWLMRWKWVKQRKGNEINEGQS